MRINFGWSILGDNMVALGEQFHHNGTQPRLQGTGYRLQRGGETVDVCNLHGPQTTDQNFGSSDGLFIDPCSLIFERSAGANEIIFCGYRYDPEAELYYVRNRSYNAVLGRWVQRDPIGYAGGLNLYGYVVGIVVTNVDPSGTAQVPTTVAGMYAALVPGRGNWSGTHLNTRGAGGTWNWYTANMNGQFNVDKKAFGNPKCLPCKEIKFVQFYIQTATNLFGHYSQSNGGNWALDLDHANAPPFYAFQSPWEADGHATEATMWDFPGAWGWLNETHYWGIEQDFMTWAVCTVGKEAGHSYGALQWGIQSRILGPQTVTIWLVGGVPWRTTVKAGNDANLVIH